jgi:hypothetical protein
VPPGLSLCVCPAIHPGGTESEEAVAITKSEFFFF